MHLIPPPVLPARGVERHPGVRSAAQVPRGQVYRPQQAHLSAVSLFSSRRSSKTGVLKENPLENSLLSFRNKLIHKGNPSNTTHLYKKKTLNS